MKKYVLLGLATGVAVSLVLYYLHRKKGEGMEFYGFMESPSTADELFGNAFMETPDKI